MTEPASPSAPSSNSSSSVLTQTPVSSTYLALVPRGLHHAVQAMITRRLTPTWKVEISLVGELQGQDANNDAAFVASQRQLFHRLEQAQQQRLLQRGGKKRPRHRQEESVRSTCRVSVGTIRDEVLQNYNSDHHDNKHRTLYRDVSFGYCNHNTNIWSVSGQLQGQVWMQIVTNCPAQILVSDPHVFRCIGPLLAVVHIWTDANLHEEMSLDETATAIQKLIQSTGATSLQACMQRALQTWHEHLQAAWKEQRSPEEMELLQKKIQGHDDTPPLTYRLSCLRTESKKYPYPRHSLLRAIAGFLEPLQQPTPWTVDLSKYDVEVSLLMDPHKLALGLTLRDYLAVGAKSFHHGNLPPDIAPPYLSRQFSQLLRLRPSTAQVLLELAQIEPGDVVLDPCAGIGTIPMETLFAGTQSVFALGGDLVLTPSGLGPAAATYAQAAIKTRRTIQETQNSMVDLAAWDASSLPIRTGSVDVIVSDLPFGKQCLSSQKVDQLVALLLGECARVLRPDSGRMVLLCGAHVPVLEALQLINNTTTNNTNESSSDSDDNVVWQFPCTSVFPVNIGGLLAWVVQVRRGSKRDVVRLPRYTERARALARRRTCSARQCNRNGSKNNPT